jgi:hypothetical protein
MYSLKPNHRRVALVGALTVLAAAGGAWAQQGTDVLLSTYESEGLYVSGQEIASSGATSGGYVNGDDTSIYEPPQPETNTSSVYGQADEYDPVTARQCQTAGSATVTDEDAVTVGPGATTGSVSATVVGYVFTWGPTAADQGFGPAMVQIRASARSDNPGPGNENTGTTYSPDRSYKITTHTMQFQNVVTDGRIAISGQSLPLDPFQASCAVDVGVTDGVIYHYRQDQHIQQNQ